MPPKIVRESCQNLVIKNHFPFDKWMQRKAKELLKKSSEFYYIYTYILFSYVGQLENIMLAKRGFVFCVINIIASLKKVEKEKQRNNIVYD